MSRIPTPATIDAAPDAALPFLKAVHGQLGSVPNLFRLLATSPAALEGYLGLSGALGKGALEPATRTRIALTVAELNGCGYCLAAHTYLGTHVAKLGAAELAANRDARSADAKAEAALRFAAQLVQGRGQVTDADVAAVKAAGHSDGAVVEIILHVAVNTLTNYVNTALATEVDFPEVPARASYADQCTVAMSMGERVASDATSTSRVDGRQFRFSSPEAKAMFDASPTTYIGKADAHWARLR